MKRFSEAMFMGELMADGKDDKAMTVEEENEWLKSHLKNAWAILRDGGYNYAKVVDEFLEEIEPQWRRRETKECPVMSDQKNQLPSTSRKAKLSETQRLIWEEFFRKHPELIPGGTVGKDEPHNPGKE